MKQCPKCRDMALYEDTSETCPFCGTKLVPYVRQRRTTGQPTGTRATGIQPTGTQPTAQRPVTPTAGPAPVNEAPPAFETSSGGRTMFRGTVVSVSAGSRFLSRGVKWANAVFRGEPYQIGNPVYETTIRVEEMQERRLSSAIRSLTFFGDAQGQVDIGDDVRAVTKRRGGRYIVQSLYINDTEARVRPGAQLPSAAVILLTAAVLLLCFALIRAVVRFFTTGAVWNLLAALVGGAVGLGMRLLSILAPVLILGLVVWLFFRKH